MKALLRVNGGLVSILLNCTREEIEKEKKSLRSMYPEKKITIKIKNKEGGKR